MNSRLVEAPQRVHTQENEECVKQALLHSPNHCARKQATELSIDNHLVMCILHEKLHFHPYRLVNRLQLRPGDYAQQLNFARQMEAIFEVNDYLILLINDKAYFHISGIVNQQNCCYWAIKNLRELYKRPLHCPKAKVWCTVGKAGFIGPYFFEDHNGNAVTVNSKCYIKVINNFFIPELQQKRIPI